MYKLGLEKVEEPEIKLTTFIESWRKQGNSIKTSTSASLTTLKPLTVWVTANFRKFLEMGIPDHLTCLLRKLYAGQEGIVRMNMDHLTGSKSGKDSDSLCVVTLFI